MPPREAREVDAGRDATSKRATVIFQKISLLLGTARLPNPLRPVPPEGDGPSFRAGALQIVSCNPNWRGRALTNET